MEPLSEKANFDVEIAVEAMDKITSYDLMILFQETVILIF